MISWRQPVLRRPLKTVLSMMNGKLLPWSPGNEFPTQGRCLLDQSGSNRWCKDQKNPPLCDHLPRCCQPEWTFGNRGANYKAKGKKVHFHEILLPKGTASLHHDSKIKVFQLRCIDKKRLSESKLGSISIEILKQLDEKVRIVTGLY